MKDTLQISRITLVDGTEYRKVVSHSPKVTEGFWVCNLPNGKFHTIVDTAAAIQKRFGSKVLHSS